jgi:hypothetical protein
MSSSGAAMQRILFSGRGPTLGLNRFDSAGELLDAALRGVQLRGADGVELLATLPERDRFVEARFPAFESLDDRLQLALGFLEGGLAQRVSSTVAPKPPVPSSTSTCAPVASAALERTILSALRTMA